MFLFLLTAQEGTVSANRFALSSSRNPQTHQARTGIAPLYLCVSSRSTGDFFEDKTGNTAGVLCRR